MSLPWLRKSTRRFRIVCSRELPSYKSRGIKIRAMPFKLAISNFTIGRHYEKVVIAILRTYSFHIWHSGRSGDKGVDFTGSWVLPNKEVPVIGERYIKVNATM